MIRKMTIEDYEGVNALWHGIKGFVLRSIDDSNEGVSRFIKRNPNTCVIAEEDGKIVGSILCGHDGRKGCMYHVCVAEEYRKRGIGTAMVAFALERLHEEEINDVSIVAFSKNDVGNKFWKKLGWEMQANLNSYEIRTNERNIRTVNEE